MDNNNNNNNKDCIAQKMVYIDKRTIKVKDEILLSIYVNYKEESPIEMITRE